MLDVGELHHDQDLLDRMEQDALHYKGAIRNRTGFEVGERA